MYRFTMQCQYCGEPIEYTDDVLYFIDRNGYVTCEKVYPEYRENETVYYHTLGD